MAKYIPLDALLAEIEKLKKSHDNWSCMGKCFHEEYENLLSFIDTLEVKEVDLEKEIELVKGDYEQVDVAWNNDFDFIARHFYELGLKAQKGEEV